MMYFHPPATADHLAQHLSNVCINGIRREGKENKSYEKAMTCKLVVENVVIRFTRDVSSEGKAFHLRVHWEDEKDKPMDCPDFGSLKWWAKRFFNDFYSDVMIFAPVPDSIATATYFHLFLFVDDNWKTPIKKKVKDMIPLVKV